MHKHIGHCCAIAGAVCVIALTFFVVLLLAQSPMFK